MFAPSNKCVFYHNTILFCQFPQDTSLSNYYKGCAELELSSKSGPQRQARFINLSYRPWITVTIFSLFEKQKKVRCYSWSSDLLCDSSSCIKIRLQQPIVRNLPPFPRGSSLKEGGELNDQIIDKSWFIHDFNYLVQQNWQHFHISVVCF